MPVYDYVCNDCHKTFELILTRINSHSEGTRSRREMPQVRQQECGAGSNRVLCRDREEELGEKPGRE